MSAIVKAEQRALEAEQRLAAVLALCEDKEIERFAKEMADLSKLRYEASPDKNEWLSQDNIWPLLWVMSEQIRHAASPVPTPEQPPLK